MQLSSVGLHPGHKIEDTRCFVTTLSLAPEWYTSRTDLVHHVTNVFHMLMRDSTWQETAVKCWSDGPTLVYSVTFYNIFAGSGTEGAAASETSRTPIPVVCPALCTVYKHSGPERGRISQLRRMLGVGTHMPV